MVETVLLISGGVDSACLAYSEQPDLGVTVDYGQACAEAEVKAAAQICDQLDIQHSVIEADCSELGSGTMSEQSQLNIASTPEWWPFRNQLIITMTATEAVKIGASELIAGSVKDDQDHADGRAKFYEKMDDLLSFQEGDLSISVPAIEQRTTELIKETGAPFSLLGWTHSCHTSNNPCGDCRGCRKRHRVLSEAFDGRA
ncbi:7-cyano-7-deazaguanine synthase (plasmid) [Halorientalis sp. IM1011]|uniref:7-cyano-7-deazaguanine synthase n=1 Tax=Halorientalis sp. IM1011 TaxID=1932360 RepID=UPI00097CC783|nr:7-cyano-7-deazaguanine synthase [Halorientalis sp. IM1011]AQL44733.1 7-cyano-7-deazaguanine synthase [Halorientalis sp. IM1011]